MTSREESLLAASFVFAIDIISSEEEGLQE